MLIQHQQTSPGIDVEGVRNSELAGTGSLDTSDDLQEPSIPGELHYSEISVVCDKDVSICTCNHIARATKCISGSAVPGHSVFTKSHDAFSIHGVLINEVPASLCEP